MSHYIVAALTPWFKSVAALTSASLHRGWGEQIEWHTMNEGLKKAAAEKKHMMLIVHLMSCPACVRHKTWFSRSQEIAELSKHFVMVNVEPWEIPRQRSDLAPDGHYVPRILFLAPTGRVLRGVRTKHPDYGYAYMDSHQLAQNMRSLAPKDIPQA